MRAGRRGSLHHRLCNSCSFYAHTVGGGSGFNRTHLESVVCGVVQAFGLARFAQVHSGAHLALISKSAADQERV